jgi:hypothetical protein
MLVYRFFIVSMYHNASLRKRKKQALEEERKQQILQQMLHNRLSVRKIWRFALYR